MTWSKKTLYTRREIHDVLGGSLQSYLPTHEGKVVAACLRKNLNPRAPNVILVGGGPRILSAGLVLAEQKEIFPVFIKESVNQWRYWGDYKCVNSVTEAEEMRQYVVGSERTDVKMVLLLKMVR